MQPCAIALGFDLAWQPRSRLRRHQQAAWARATAGAMVEPAATVRDGRPLLPNLTLDHGSVLPYFRYILVKINANLYSVK